MRQRRTRWSALLLAVAMVFSLLTISAAAVEGVDTWDGETVDVTWYDASKDSFTLTSAAQLAGLAQLVNGDTNFLGKTVSLDKDIDLAGHEWTPIGKSGKSFQGTFDGQNHTISNLVVNQPAMNDVGLFGFTQNGAVQNFTLENAAVTGYLDVGAVAGMPYTSAYSNIQVTGTVQVEGFSYVGGAFGKNVYKSITNVDVLADAGSYVRADSVENGIAYRTYIGGLAGFMGEGKITVQDCDVEIDVIGSSYDVGGILGILHYNNTLQDCTYRGSLTVTNPVESENPEFGALVGVIQNAQGTTAITDCTGTVVQATVGSEDVTAAIRPFGGFYYPVGSASDKGSITVDATVNDKPFTASNNAARIGDMEYKTLSAAIAEAVPGDTVELLNDVTVDVWNQAWNAKDLTINGNGYTWTVGKVESNVNGNYLFYGAENLQVNDLTVIFQTNGNGFDMVSGSLDNVTMYGGKNSNYAVFVGSSDEEEASVYLHGCYFDGFDIAIYSQPVSSGKHTSDLTVDSTEFANCGMTMCSYAQHTVFTNNSVTGGSEISFAGAAESADRDNTYLVTGNTFQNAGKLWFNGADLGDVTFAKNKVLGTTYVSTDVAQTGKLDVSENYWGGDAPSAEQCVGDDIVGKDVYYQSADMDEGDLNTDCAVTLVYNNGEKDQTVYITAGEKYTLPAKPSKKGYTFLGWKSSVDREVYKAEATVKITRDTTFTAQWMSNWEIVDGIAGAAGSGKEFFTDVSVGDWYYEAVKFVFDNNFMDGVGDGKFNPDGTLTRAMIAQVLYNLEGETSSYPTVFDDVAKSAWYADAVNWAAASGIVEGKGNNKFDPNAAITRQEMAAILYRYSELKGYDVSKVDSLAAFTDANKVASWAKEAMGWAVENYVINGKGAGKLDPTGTATRAEVAQILMNLCNNVL